MNKELLTIALAFGCIAANANTNNYDLLGRKGSKMNTPMVYRNVDYSKAKKNEQQKLNSSLENRGLAKQAVGLKGNAKAIIGVSSPKKNGLYGFKVCESGQGCGFIKPASIQSRSLSQYLTEANKYFIPVYTDNRPIYNNDYFYESAGTTRAGYSGFTMGEAPYDMPQNEFLSYSSYETINNLLLKNNEANSNVGVYLAEKGLPVRLDPWTDPNPNAPFIIADNNAVMESFNTMPGDEMDASRMYKLVHRFSDRSVVYSTLSRPSNPADNRLGPQIYMGVHGYGGSAKTSYNSMAQSLDNYIYNNRTVEIVAAGDNANKLSAEGFAVNAITVGAIDSKTGNVASYSGKDVAVDDLYVNGEYVKPNIHNYTKFYMDDFFRSYNKPNKKPAEYKPFYDSTRAATGVTAGMVSNMLSKNEFYRWHPEVVKAVMLNAKNADHLNYDGLVFKKQTTLKDREYQHLSMYFIGDVNTLMDKYKTLEITLTNSDLGNIFGVGFERIDGIRVALSWLNSGNDIERLGDVPQKFGIFIFTQHGLSDRYYLREWASSLKGGRTEYRFYENYPYRYAMAWGYAMANPDNFNKIKAPNYKIQIVLEDDDSRSENYGQMALGVDIMPIIYDK